MADSVVGFVGKDFSIVAADASIARGILAYKHDEDKITQLDDGKLLACAGDTADRGNFAEYIDKNLKLSALREGEPLSTHAAASFTRNQLATALRRAPYNVNCLLAGYDKDDGPSLYFMDYLASMQKMKFAAHGYAGYFLYALLDRHWKPKMNEEQAIKLMKACIKQLATRFLIHQPNFVVKIVDASGVRQVDVSA